MNDSTLSSLEKRVLDRISEKRWMTLAAELIRTGQPRSGNPLDPDMPGGEEEAIAMLTAGKLEALGMEVQTLANVPGRPNVVATLKGTGVGPSLMMNDHLDTYPVVRARKMDDDRRQTLHGKAAWRFTLCTRYVRHAWKHGLLPAGRSGTDRRRRHL